MSDEPGRPSLEQFFARTLDRVPPRVRDFVQRRPRVSIAGAAGAVVLLVIVSLLWALPLGRALEPLPDPTLVLVSADGKPFARRGSYKEAPVVASELPKHVTDAFLSIEDRRFYRHFGVDPRAIARAFRNNVRAGGVAEGGSTITQQLAKNAFLTNKRNLRRKAQEAIIALYLEARLSKDEILSRYLSSVYFGDGVFGLRAAARHYFDKAPEKLTIGEAAMLAGVVKAPSKLAPTDDIEAARERARVVLAAMVDTGAITQAQARKARKVRVREGRSNLPVGSYFADWVSPQAKESFERAYGEVEVRTTLDSRLQRQAERAVRQAMAGREAQAALVAMRPDGSVVAMVGGRDYRRSQFNRAEAQRQPGSAFKLFVYLAALRKGATPDTMVLDQPVRVGNWTPQNHEGAYRNRPITYREAFARSSNAAAVRVMQKAGLANVIRAAKDLGITSKLPRDATVALGSGPVSLVELTGAYAAIAAGRAPVRPHGLAGPPPAGGTTRISRREQQAMLDMLHAVVTGGTGRGAAMAQPVYGKTGTSQDYRDALFVGFSGDLIVGVWVGNDDNTPMQRVTGGMLPARIWRDFMTSAVGLGAVRGVQAPPAEEVVEPLSPEELAPEELEGLPDFETGEPEPPPLDIEQLLDLPPPPAPDAPILEAPAEELP